MHVLKDCAKSLHVGHSVMVDSVPNLDLIASPFLPLVGNCSLENRVIL